MHIFVAVDLSTLLERDGNLDRLGASSIRTTQGRDHSKTTQSFFFMSANVENVPFLPNECDKSEKYGIWHHTVQLNPL